MAYEVVLVFLLDKDLISLVLIHTCAVKQIYTFLRVSDRPEAIDLGSQFA